MSLPEMQTALAMIVRYPTSFQGRELARLLAEFDLTPNERIALSQIAGDRELGKFGYGLLDMRWNIIEVRLPLLKRAVSPEMLFEIFQELFDPQSTEIANSDLPIGYLDFLETNAEARARLEIAAPDYVWDFIAFEKVQLEIERDRWHGLPEPEARSPLASLAIYPRAFQFNLPEYLLSLGEATPLAAPRRESVFTLLLGTETLPGYRIFELDAETFAFLQIALAGGRADTSPASLPDLIAAGVCKAGPYAA